MPSIKAHDAQHLSAAFDGEGIYVTTGDIRPLVAMLAGRDSLIGEELDWAARALCPQTDPESFFPEKGGTTREAKRVCRSCEVRPECLEYALEHDERFGIWGGMSERERRRLKRQTG